MTGALTGPRTAREGTALKDTASADALSNRRIVSSRRSRNTTTPPSEEPSPSPAPRYEAKTQFGGVCQGIFPALTNTPEL